MNMNERRFIAKVGKYYVESVYEEQIILGDDVDDAIEMTHDEMVSFNDVTDHSFEIYERVTQMVKYNIPVVRGVEE